VAYAGPIEPPGIRTPARPTLVENFTALSPPIVELEKHDCFLTPPRALPSNFSSACPFPPTPNADVQFPLHPQSCVDYSGRVLGDAENPPQVARFRPGVFLCARHLLSLTTQYDSHNVFVFLLDRHPVHYGGLLIQPSRSQTA